MGEDLLQKGIKRTVAIIEDGAEELAAKGVTELPEVNNDRAGGEGKLKDKVKLSPEWNRKFNSFTGDILETLEKVVKEDVEKGKRRNRTFK